MPATSVSDAIAAARELIALSGERVTGEPTIIDFDPEKHPGMLHRGMLAGYDIGTMAVIFGVTEERLKGWIDSHAAMKQAAKDMLMRDADVVNSLYELAIGWTDPETGQRTKPNAQAAMFLARTRAGFKEPDQREPVGRDDLTTDQMFELVKALEKTLRGAPLEGQAKDVTNEGDRFDEFS